MSIARCEVETIHERHDTLFGGKLPAPNAATLRSLQNYVLDRGCDIGIATDGDADRIGVIDDQGHFIGIITRRDIIGYCYDRLKECGE